MRRPVVAELRRLGFRVVAYVDDFEGAPPSRPGQAATTEDALVGTDAVRSLLARLGLTLHPFKGVWTGPTSLPLLGHVVDTVRAQFILRPERAAKIMTLAGGLLHWAAKHKRWVRVKTLRNFCGMAVSKTLSVTTARHHLRSLYTTLGGRRAGMSYTRTRQHRDGEPCSTGPFQRAGSTPPASVARISTCWS